MDLGLTGKVAIVTGASEGIGKETAAVLLREGAKVAICSRRAAAVEATVGELESYSAHVLGVPADASKPDDLRRLVDAAVARFGRIDILVNNAGTSKRGAFMENDDSVWAADFEMKVFAAIRLSKLCIPHMRKVGGGAPSPDSTKVASTSPAKAPTPTMRAWSRTAKRSCRTRATLGLHSDHRSNAGIARENFDVGVRSNGAVVNAPHGYAVTLKGIAAMITGMAFLVVSDAVSKYLTQSQPIGQVICIRQLASLVFVAMFVACRRSSFAVLRPKNVRMQVLRGLAFVGSSYSIVLSLSLLPLPTVTAITFSGPIMIALMSAPMLGERVASAVWGATLLGFAGVLFIIRPGSADFSWALLIPVVAAFASSLRDVFARILARTDDSIAILFWSSAIVAAATAPTAFWGWASMPATIWGLYLVAGLVNFCAHLLIIESYRLGRAAVVAPFKYTSLLWSALLGYIIWSDLPGGWMWAGAAILVASGLWIARSQRG